MGETTGKKIRNIVLLVLAMLLVLGAAVMIFQNRFVLDIGGFWDALFGNRNGKSEASVFEYSRGTDSAYTDLGSGLAIVSRTGVHIYDGTGAETVVHTVSLGRPAVFEREEKAVGYDVGGTFASVFTVDKELFSLETDYGILSASLNKNGWLALTTEDATYRGLVTVYNAAGKAVYQWYSGTGYVLKAEVAPNNKYVTAAVLSENGSSLACYSLSSEEEQNRVELGESVVYDITYLDNNTVVAVTDKTLFFVNPLSGITAQVDYSSKSLVGWSLKTQKPVLVVSDYQVSTTCTLMSVDKNGSVLGQTDLDGRPTAVTAGQSSIGVAYQDSVSLYNTALTRVQNYTDLGNLLTVLVRDDGDGLAVGAFSAARLVYVGS